MTEPTDTSQRFTFQDLSSGVICLFGDSLLLSRFPSARISKHAPCDRQKLICLSDGEHRCLNKTPIISEIVGFHNKYLCLLALKINISWLFGYSGAIKIIVLFHFITVAALIHLEVS